MHYIYVFVCVYVCARACVRLWARIVCVRVHVRVVECVYVYMYARVSMCVVCVHEYVCECMRMFWIGAELQKVF